MLVPKEFCENIKELDFILATVIQIEGQQDPIKKASE